MKDHVMSGVSRDTGVSVRVRTITRLWFGNGSNLGVPRLP